MEMLWYEFRPWLFATFAFLSMVKAPDSRLLYGSGLLLMVACFAIIGARYRHRTVQTRR